MSADTFYTRSGLSPPDAAAVAVRALLARGLWRGSPDAWPSLSVKDPWIALIGDGRKPFEIRKRVTHYRGPVVLCSSVNPARDAQAERARLAYGRAYWPTPPLGYALFVGVLFDCRPSTRADAKGACGVPEPGTYVWHFRDVRPMLKPLPVTGKLGLYVTARNVLAAAKRARK